MTNDLMRRSVGKFWYIEIDDNHDYHEGFYWNISKSSTLDQLKDEITTILTAGMHDIIVWEHAARKLYHARIVVHVERKVDCQFIASRPGP